MGFWNVQQGDAPYFTKLARAYALSDNFHQAIEGGTGANHLMVGFGTTIYYADSTGAPGDAAVQPDREPEAAAGHEQLVYPGRIRWWFLRAVRDSSKPGIGGVQTI